MELVSILLDVYFVGAISVANILLGLALKGDTSKPFWELVAQSWYGWYKLTRTTKEGSEK